jgi:hypothetical protein
MITTLRFKRSKRIFGGKFLRGFAVWIGVLNRKSLPRKEFDPWLDQIKTFDEWLSYIKEKDPQAFQELIDLIKESMTRKEVR